MHGCQTTTQLSDKLPRNACSFITELPRVSHPTTHEKFEAPSRLNRQFDLIKNFKASIPFDKVYNAVYYIFCCKAV